LVFKMKCPRCGAESKPTGKKWKYAVFDVESHSCEKCNKQFNAYYRDGKLSHTIPKSK